MKSRLRDWGRPESGMFCLLYLCVSVSCPSFPPPFPLPLPKSMTFSHLLLNWLLTGFRHPCFLFPPFFLATQALRADIVKLKLNLVPTLTPFMAIYSPAPATHSHPSPFPPPPSHTTTPQNWIPAILFQSIVLPFVLDLCICSFLSPEFCLPFPDPKVPFGSLLNAIFPGKASQSPGLN